VCRKGLACNPTICCFNCAGPVQMISLVTKHWFLFMNRNENFETRFGLQSGKRKRIAKRTISTKLTDYITTKIAHTYMLSIHNMFDSRMSPCKIPCLHRMDFLLFWLQKPLTKPWISLKSFQTITFNINTIPFLSFLRCVFDRGLSYFDQIYKNKCQTNTRTFNDT
jgi:hypothetical protein